MKALDVMVSPVITVAPETLVADAAEILLSNRISGVPVVDKGTLVGIRAKATCSAAPRPGPSVAGHGCSKC
jgi:CBS domain-containing protein